MPGLLLQSLSCFLLLIYLGSCSPGEDLEEQAMPSNPDLLIELYQSINAEGLKLKNLRADSAEVYPYFKQIAGSYYHTELILDSLRRVAPGAESTGYYEQRWEMLRDGFNYLLNRRRRLNQQIMILRRKIQTKNEILNVAIKGREVLVFDIVNKNLSFSNKLSELSDSVWWAGESTFMFDSINIDETASEYSWQLVEKERELELLLAKFAVAKTRWLLLSQLLELNRDQKDVIGEFSKRSADLYDQWKTSMQTLQTRQDSLGANTAGDSVQEAINNRIRVGLNYITKLQSELRQDSLSLRDVSAEVQELEAWKVPLTEDVRASAISINKKIREINYLKSPLAPQRIYSFLVTSGPVILFLILFFVIVWFVSRWLAEQILQGIGRHMKEKGPRIDTLSRAIRSALTVLIIFFAALAILSEVGINISVLLGGAAVFSLAIAFGAQSLVKDFFSGFMILTENQYRIGNVIKVNNIAGAVEDISLRTTILRDEEGIAHFIPHGEISTVSNLTHRWSRVVLKIEIAYSENVNKAMEVILQVAEELCADPEFAPRIARPPEMQGVDELAESAVIIKILLKTTPSSQWMIKREFLRRIKIRFDELDIEFPFKQLTIHHRNPPIPSQKNQESP